MNADEWEVVDDNGFIYKRRKKRAVLPPSATLVKGQDPVLPNQAELRVGEAQAGRKKMAMLLAQKEMYVVEVRDWELLLSKQEDALACAPVSQSPTSHEQVSLRSIEDATSQDDLQSLHLQVEAYEQFIEQLQSLCDQGETMCKILEKDAEKGRLHFEQELLKEVVKVTPRTIIHSLTSEPAPPLPATDHPGNSFLGRLMGDYG